MKFMFNRMDHKLKKDLLQLKADNKLAENTFAAKRIMHLF